MKAKVSFLLGQEEGPLGQWSSIDNVKRCLPVGISDSIPMTMSCIDGLGL